MHLIKKILVPHFLHFLLSVMLGVHLFGIPVYHFYRDGRALGRRSNFIFAKSFPPRPDTTKPCISKFENITSGTRATKQSILYFKISLLQLGQMQNHSYRKQWKSLYEITHQRSLLASAQRLRGDGLQGLSFSPLSLMCLNQLISGDILWVIHDRGTAAWLPRVCVDLVQNQRWMGWVQQVKAIVQDLCLNFKTKEEWGGSSSVQELAQE